MKLGDTVAVVTTNGADRRTIQRGRVVGLGRHFVRVFDPQRRHEGLRSDWPETAEWFPIRSPRLEVVPSAT